MNNHSSIPSVFFVNWSRTVKKNFPSGAIKMYDSDSDSKVVVVQIYYTLEFKDAVRECTEFTRQHACARWASLLLL